VNVVLRLVDVGACGRVLVVGSVGYRDVVGWDCMAAGCLVEAGAGAGFDVCVEIRGFCPDWKIDAYVGG